MRSIFTIHYEYKDAKSQKMAGAKYITLVQSKVAGRIRLYMNKKLIRTKQFHGKEELTAIMANWEKEFADVVAEKEIRILI